MRASLPPLRGVADTRAVSKPGETPTRTGGKERGSEVQSVARASALLEAVVDSAEGLTLTELVRESGLTMSTVHRLLRTLCSGGLLCRDSGTERFLPGPLLLRLARRSLASAGVPEAADVLRDLVDRTGETASLGMRQGEQVLVLLVAQSAQPLRFQGVQGEHRALLRSAMGRALLAVGDRPVREVLDELLPGAGEEERWEHEVDLMAARFRGCAVFDDPDRAGLRAIAAPVPGHRDGGRLVVEVQGPAARMADEELDRLGAAVRAAAEELHGLPLSLGGAGT
ncbi:IclR family transcriptional regulator [Saccharopolyspora gregorii]|uniref:IclR family transcriptional regulator n=1 Tax=Saccharopolyspora gregorii TaxID=33914 RepID=A0ABP6RTG7_9PSEU